MCLPAFRTCAVAGMTVLLTAIRTCSKTAGTNDMKPVITCIEGAFWMDEVQLLDFPINAMNIND